MQIMLRRQILLAMDKEKSLKILFCSKTIQEIISIEIVEPFSSYNIYLFIYKFNLFNIFNLTFFHGVGYEKHYCHFQE